MKKTIMLIMSVVALLMFLSAFKRGVMPLTGSIVPSIKIENQNSELSLDKYKGKHLMLTFWSSADAQSRIRNNELQAFVRALNDASDESEKPLEFVSINFDRSESLFNEIVRRDNLDRATQFYVTGSDASRIRRDFGLERGYKSFLIDPEGKIMEVNPGTDSERLKETLKNASRKTL